MAGTPTITQNTGNSTKATLSQSLYLRSIQKYRSLSRRQSRAIAGLSMGGFGTIKFGLKYPEMFRSWVASAVRYRRGANRENDSGCDRQDHRRDIRPAETSAEIRTTRSISFVGPRRRRSRPIRSYISTAARRIFCFRIIGSLQLCLTRKAYRTSTPVAGRTTGNTGTGRFKSSLVGRPQDLLKKVHGGSDQDVLPPGSGRSF